MGGTRAQKAEYFVKLRNMLETYESIMLVTIDNVGSNQMHHIRMALRGKATVLFGKNTMIRRALREFTEEFPQFIPLMEQIKGNCGFVFTNENLKDIRDIIETKRVAAPARAGAIAPLDVFVPAGNTGMEPGKTSFFQALGVPTKISRGTIEITNEVHLIRKDTKVGASEASLLNLLGVSPFTYGMVIEKIFQNGNVFSPEILDIEESAFLKFFTSAIQTVASVSLGANYPTIVSVSHSLLNSYKNVLAASVATEYTYDGSEKIKEILANPEAFAAAAASSAPAAADSAAAPAAEEKEEEAEDSDEDMGMSLFD